MVASTNPGGRKAFGALEHEVLRVLWSQDTTVTAREVLERLDGRPAYTTVTTILDRLSRKGLAARERRGRAFAYRPLRTERSMTTDRVRALLDSGGDRIAVLQGLVSALSDDDADELQHLLRQATQARKRQP